MYAILLGPPGAGKGTQAKYIAKRYGIPHISTGNMLRRAIEENTTLGKRIKESISRGELTPDDVIIDLVKERIAKSDCKNGFLFDGVPRTMVQVRALEEAGVPIKVVIIIDCSDEEIVARISNRLIHFRSGRIYHAISNPPKEEGKDDETGEPLAQRDDDKEEVVRNRLGIYHRVTAELVDYYLERESSGDLTAPKCIRVSGESAIEEICDRILAELDALW
ncbi:MAG: adenylate kinase [Patescibacteria group bacterium]|nr:adenylate kinase [Patescibacteria group bacterium]